MPAKKITDQQEVAISALFDNGFSDKRAALDKAKYSRSNSPHKVFGKPAVKAEIEIRQKALARKHGIEQDNIIAELVKIGFNGLGDLIKVDKNGDATLDFTKLTDAHRAGIKSFTSKVYMEGKGTAAKEVKETKVEFISKIAAFEALSKHLGLHDKGDEGAKDLIQAIMSGRKRVRIQIDDG